MTSAVSEERVFTAFLASRWVVHGSTYFCSLADFKQAARQFGQLNQLPPFACNNSTINHAIGGDACITTKQRRRGKNTVWVDGLTVTTPTHADLDTENRLQLFHGPTQQIPNPYRPREREIQKLLASQLHGSRMEVPVPMGRVDLVSDDPPLVIEIKYGAAWMHGLGQVLVYGSCFPTHAKILQLFGQLPANTDPTTVTTHCRAHGVAVWFWPHK